MKVENNNNNYKHKVTNEEIAIRRTLSLQSLKN